MTAHVSETGSYKNITGSTQIATYPVDLLGFYVNSTTGGTLVLTDSASSTGGTALGGTITPAAGTFHRYPASCGSGLYVTVANTINVTIFYVPARGT